jgi:glycosyltransferase involved in cell wall biosynthesis
MTELEAAGVPRERLAYVPNAWTPAVSAPLDRAAARDALGLSPDAFVVGWVGRLGREKGPDILLAALAQLRMPWQASVIGDGPDRPALERQARAHGIEDRIHWHGVRDRADRLYGAFDVFVLSSRTEGVPLVLFEAMAAGAPIVAARVGGVPEVLGEGDALLVAPEDPAALAAAVAGVHADPHGARACAQRAARILAERFDADRWLERYEDVYGRAARAATRRRAGTSSPESSGA